MIWTVQVLHCDSLQILGHWYYALTVCGARMRPVAELQAVSLSLSHTHTHTHTCLDLTKLAAAGPGSHWLHSIPMMVSSHHPTRHVFGNIDACMLRIPISDNVTASYSINSSLALFQLQCQQHYLQYVTDGFTKGQRSILTLVVYPGWSLSEGTCLVRHGKS